MKKFTAFGAAVLLGASFATSAFALEPTEYLRKGDQVIVVFENEGKLYCRRTADNFELCHGMEANADGSYKGKNMKHPDMPGFMTFDGTVVFSDTGLNIQGCVLGGICDAEEWTLK